MITPAQLATAFARNTRLLQMQADGLSQADSLLQPEPSGNCLNWVLGHLLLSREEMLDQLGAERVLPADATARYDRGGAPIRQDDPTALPLPTLLEALETSQERLDRLLGAATEDDMTRPIQWGANEHPLGDYLFFMYFHEAYHTGQTELLRQLAGKTEPVIR